MIRRTWLIVKGVFMKSNFTSHRIPYALKRRTKWKVLSFTYAVIIYTFLTAKKTFV